MNIIFCEKFCSVVRHNYVLLSFRHCHFFLSDTIISFFQTLLFLSSRHCHFSFTICINSVEQEFKIQSHDAVLGDQRLHMDHEIGR
jgi:hypothetical protein